MNRLAFGEKFDSLLEALVSDLSTPEKRKRALDIRNLYKCYIVESNKLDLLELEIDRCKMNVNEHLVSEWGHLTALTNSMYFLLLSELDPDNQSLLKMEFEARNEINPRTYRQDNDFNLS